VRCCAYCMRCSVTVQEVALECSKTRYYVVHLHIETAEYPNTPGVGREFLFSVAGSRHLLQHPNSQGVGPGVPLFGALKSTPGALQTFENTPKVCGALQES
jgi:hypothetical protein